MKIYQKAYKICQSRFKSVSTLKELPNRQRSNVNNVERVISENRNWNLLCICPQKFPLKYFSCCDAAAGAGAGAGGVRGIKIDIYWHFT